MQAVILWATNATQSLLNSQHFTSTLLFLAISIVFALTLGRQAKTSFVKKAAPLLSVIVLAIFVAGTYNIVLLFGEAGYNWIFCITAEFVFLVFALGGIVVTNQDMTYENGVIAIRRKSLICKLLVDWAGLNVDAVRTLCELSWVGAAFIILWPLLVLVVYAIGGVIVLGSSLFSFLFFGMNPILFCIDTQRYGRMPEIYLGNVRGIPTSPALYASVVWLLWWVYYMTVTSFAMQWVLGILAFLAVISLSLIFFMYTDGRKRLDHQEYIDDEQDYTGPGRFIGVSWEERFRPTLTHFANAILSPFQISYKAFRSFKKDFCPPVKIVSEE